MKNSVQTFTDLFKAYISVSIKFKSEGFEKVELSRIPVTYTHIIL